MKHLLLIPAITLLAIGSGMSQNRYSQDEVSGGEGELVLKSDMKPVNGVVYSKHDNGQLRAEISYKDGKYDGPVKRWHKNGQLRFAGTFKAGHSIHTNSWHYNGQLKYVNEEKAGKQHVKSWYNTGKRQHEYIYKNNVLVSSKEWDEEGNLTQDKTY